MLKDGSWTGFLALTGGGVFLIALAIVHFPRNAFLGMLFLALAGLPIAVAFLGVHLRKKRYGDGPTTDERERWIRARADNVGAIALVILWTLACAVPFAIASAQNKQTISIDRSWLLLALILGFVLMSVVRTAAIQHIRRRELANGKG